MSTLSLPTRTSSLYRTRVYHRTAMGFVAAVPLPCFDRVSHTQVWATPVPVKVRKAPRMQSAAC